MRHRVLLIDDSPVIRSLLRELLTSLGHEVVGEANSAASGLQAHVRLKPDLTMLDISLPDADGLKVLTHLRATGSKAAVIMVSANDQDKTVQSARQLGALLVAKPFSAESLAKAIAQTESLPR